MNGRWHRVVSVGLGALAASACLAAAATLPGAPQPEPIVPAPLERSAAGCAARVTDDWVDDGHVQGTYPLRCYRAAIAALPEDLRAYSTAPDDLERAMRSAVHDDARTLAAAER